MLPMSPPAGTPGPEEGSGPGVPAKSLNFAEFPGLSAARGPGRAAGSGRAMRHTSPHSTVPKETIP